MCPPPKFIRRKATKTANDNERATGVLNIGFSEILVVSVIGLIVIGPKRLPQTARFLGHFVGRIQRQIAGVKADIKREMDLEDMKNIHRDYQETANSMRHVFDQAAKPMRDAAEEAAAAVKPPDDTADKSAAVAKPPPDDAADKLAADKPAAV